MVATPSSGDPILASDIKVPRYIAKTSSEIVNNSNTLQNDNELFIALAVGVYRIEAFIHFTTNTAADFRCAWTTTGTMTSIGRSVLGGGTSMTAVTDSTVRNQGLAIGTANDVTGNTTASNVVREDLLIDVTVAGTLQLQWAQQTANASDTTVTTASRMFITEVEAA